MKRWMPLLFGLLLVFSLGLAACGGDDDDGDDDTEEIEDAAQGVATEVVDAAQGAATEVSDAAGEVAGAAGTAEAEVMGDATNGQTLFGSQGCANCHAVEGDQVIVGPSLAGVADRADERVEGMDAVAYLHQSLVEPDAYIVPDFSPGIMPSYAQLPESDLNDLVAYLMTLRAE